MPTIGTQTEPLIQQQFYTKKPELGNKDLAKIVQEVIEAQKRESLTIESVLSDKKVELLAQGLDVGVPSENPKGSKRAEDLPYLASKKPVETKYYFGDGVVNTIAASLAWTTRRVLHYIRTSFYETEYEMLCSHFDGDQELRVTKSWFFGDGREDLYALSPGFFQIKNWTINPWKKLFNEGLVFSRSDKFNNLKIAELTPRIMLERIEEIQSEFQTRYEHLAKQAIVILRDEKYDNVAYMNKLIRQLLDLIHDYKAQTAAFAINRSGTGSCEFKKIHESLVKSLTANETGFGLLKDIQNKNRYKIDQLLSDLYHFFKIADDELFNNANLVNTKIKTKVVESKSTTQEEAKEKLLQVMQLMRYLVNNNQLSKKKLEAMVDCFEEERAVII